MDLKLISIDSPALDVSVEILRALAHPLRLRILSFIDAHSSVKVNEIYQALGLEQSITSQHLRILRTAGLVSSKRMGKFMYYQLHYGRLSHTGQAVQRFVTINQPVSQN